jgi:hypothetical protein
MGFAALYLSYPGLLLNLPARLCVYFTAIFILLKFVL